MTSASFSLGRSRSIHKSDTFNWQNETTELLLTGATGEASALNDSVTGQNNLSRHSSHHSNPLGLSHQGAEFELLPAPVTARPGSVRSKSSVRASPGGMPSPDDTLVGASSPPRASRWGRLWKFGSKGLHHRIGSNEALTTDISPIAGARGPSMPEDGGGDGCGNESSPCPSRREIQSPNVPFFPTKLLVILSLYSTACSFVFLYFALAQPRWPAISSTGRMTPSSSRTLTAFISKTIEMSFATIFMVFIGQALTRRAISNESRGLTLAEIRMRSWVIQPGSLLWQPKWRAIAIAPAILCVAATLVTTFYTTTSEAMISPKLKFGAWEDRVMSGYVRSSYANSDFVHQSCPTMLRKEEKDYRIAEASCTDVMISGESYRNLQAFMGVWADINLNGSSKARDVKDRPAGTATLNGTTILHGAWIETGNSNVTAHFEKSKRIINNVTLAMPHPGVAYAAMSPLNGILQPRDLDGVGEYAVKAGVVSPAVNVLCINMNRDELAPLVYTEWPFANNTRTGLGEQHIGWENWTLSLPPITNDDEGADYLNRTVVDDLFLWGPRYKRRPPVFRLFPVDYNTVVNTGVSMPKSEALYIMGKSPKLPDYTVCELRSWLSPRCSTQFNISGITGSKLIAHCEDPDDPNNYRRSFGDTPKWEVPERDWKWLAEQWRLASDLNGGERNSNPANSRILTQLVLQSPELPTELPSLAEALAVFASSTLVLGSVDTPFKHWWNYTQPGNILGAPGLALEFNASLATQQYTSSYVSRYYPFFYIVLVLMFILNCLCLAYIVSHSKLVTDFTDTHNLFVLALNSAPSAEIRGSCGGGPEGGDWMVPWHVGHDAGTNHYYIEKTDTSRWRRYCSKNNRDSSASYESLAKQRPWIL